MELASRERIFAELDAWAATPECGLPNELFRFLSRLIPLVNVDLLVTDERLGTLLTWRDDENYGPGWHLPGGIIRYKETAEARIQLTAINELGTEVEFEVAPIAIEQHIDRKRRERGHMISMLYRCRLAGAPVERLRQNPDAPEAGQWAWHRECPANLIPEQDRYRRFF
jgi:colanic acid biosynthesis protein WcaH